MVNRVAPTHRDRRLPMRRRSRQGSLPTPGRTGSERDRHGELSFDDIALQGISRTVTERRNPTTQE